MIFKNKNNSDIYLNSFIISVSAFFSALLTGVILEWIGIPTWTFWFVLSYLILIVFVYQVLVLFFALPFQKAIYFMERQKRFYKKLLELYRFIRSRFDK